MDKSKKKNKRQRVTDQNNSRPYHANVTHMCAHGADDSDSDDDYESRLTRIEKAVAKNVEVVGKLLGHNRNRDMYIESVLTDYVCQTVNECLNQPEKKCWHVSKFFNQKFQTERNGERRVAIEIDGLVQCEAVDNCKDRMLIIIEAKSCLEKATVRQATEKKETFWRLIQIAKQKTDGASPRDIPGYLSAYQWYCGLREEDIILAIGSNLVNNEHAEQIAEAGHLALSCNTCAFQKESIAALKEWVNRHCTPQHTAHVRTTTTSGPRRAGARLASRP